ncbi:MAG: ketoacyl-ACP synthase III [Candidatus Eremiobacteraeota bacterium]|nr:ketoacyl-ACP synthase III [Candidatus Eremiobacteraeota bacterium]
MIGYGVTIAGVGQFAPPGILTNEDFEKFVDTSDEWIVQRTGMKRRHIAGPAQATSDIALPAALAALDAAAKSPADVECIVVATATPDFPFPATACILAARLGIAGIPAFDVQIACSGFVYGLTTAAALVRSGVYKTVLLLGCETLSKITDYTDRTTCVLFGDGAGAVVLERSDVDCFLGCDLGTDGRDVSALYMPVGGSRNPSGSKGFAGADRGAFIRMQGQSVFKIAVQQMAASTSSALRQACLGCDRVDFIIPHQANLRIIDATVKALKLPPERCVINIQEYGNTSSASIPMALAEAVADGRIRKDHIVVFVAFGGGLSWGAVVWRWGGAAARLASEAEHTAAVPA